MTEILYIVLRWAVDTRMSAHVGLAYGSGLMLSHATFFLATVHPARPGYLAQS